MEDYIFIDNWVLDSLKEQRFADSLRKYIIDNNYTVLLSSLSLVELYNPGWKDSDGPERMQYATAFYARVPSVIVDPNDVWSDEVDNGLDTIQQLPIRLDLREIDEALREETLLKFLRSDQIFLDQGKDIREWARSYSKVKEMWLINVEEIIANALEDDYLARDSKGKLCNFNENKELFLYSLDMRLVPEEKVNGILDYQMRKRTKNSAFKVSSVRMASLVFWYLYVKVDPANRVKTNGSDVGDLYHLSLLPYCKAFTADKSMSRLLRRIKEPCVPLGCRVFSKPDLLKVLKLK